MYIIVIFNNILFSTQLNKILVNVMYDKYITLQKPCQRVHAFIS